MNIIIAAILGGAVLLWGGVFVIYKLVETIERKHLIFLSAYATLVAGSVMALVLYTNYERQKEHRQQLTEQMDVFSSKLNSLSARLAAQLEEKANLTQSEFEVRRDLQNERKNHVETKSNLEEQIKITDTFQNKLSSERNKRLLYQQEINKKIEERSAQEDDRFDKITRSQDIAQRALIKHLTQINDEISKLSTSSSSLTSQQNTLLAKINMTREIQELLTQKFDALARSHAALYDDLNGTMAAVDSLYKEEFD
jgi:chromosome segregation ATPase